MLPDNGCSQQSLSFPSRVVFFIEGSSVYVVDNGSNKSCRGPWAMITRGFPTLSGSTDIML